MPRHKLGLPGIIYSISYPSGKRTLAAFRVSLKSNTVSCASKTKPSNPTNIKGGNDTEINMSFQSLITVEKEVVTRLSASLHLPSPLTFTTIRSDNVTSAAMPNSLYPLQSIAIYVCEMPCPLPVSIPPFRVKTAFPPLMGITSSVSKTKRASPIISPV